jgi:hypothetical protein
VAPGRKMSSVSSFEEYWVTFVRAHVNVATRRVQFVATSLGLASALAGVVWRRGMLVVLAPAIAWLPTWLAQRAFEEGAPPPRHTGFAVAANLKMWRMTLDGTMDDEVDRLVPVDGRSPGRAGTPQPNMVTDHTLH